MGYVSVPFIFFPFIFFSSARMKNCHSSDLILDDPHVVVGGLRVELRLSLQVELQSLHVEPKVPGVRVALRRVAEEDGQTDRSVMRPNHSCYPEDGRLLTCRAASGWAGSDRSWRRGAA